MADPESLGEGTNLSYYLFKLPYELHGNENWLGFGEGHHAAKFFLYKSAIALGTTETVCFVISVCADNDNINSFEVHKIVLNFHILENNIKYLQNYGCFRL